MAAKTPADALDEALSKLGGVEPAEIEEEETSTDDESTDETLSDEESDDSADESEDDAEGDEESGDEDGETDEESEESTEEEESEEGQETPEQKTTREAAEKVAARKPQDIVNDPMPEGLNKRTNERITGLISMVKDLTPRAAQGDELIGYIEQSGMNADEFAMALTFGRLKHSDSVDDQRQAYIILMQGIKELAPLIGETLPGVDTLEGHADLQQRVQAGKLDAKDAAEIARARNRDKAAVSATQRAAQNRTAQQQTAAQTKELEENCRQELNELGQQLADVDKRFEERVAKIPQATMAQIKRTPPALRVNAFLKAYRAVKLAPKVVVANKTPKNQPLRANRQPASGGAPKREAKSAVEAMEFALGLR